MADLPFTLATPNSPMTSDLASLLDTAFQARRPLLASGAGAVRLFNGFYEGAPDLAVDLYGRTVVIHDYAGKPGGDPEAARQVVEAARAHVPRLAAVVWKARRAEREADRNGRLLLGTPAELERRVEENGVRYALALTMHQDASLYLDTRNLRAWAKATLGGKRVLNTFAYTGSLGVAACAAPAREVVHLDLSREYLNVAKDSYALNGFPVRRSDFRPGNFFEQTSRLKREGQLFDCIFLDPPFFSTTPQGRVDLESGMDRLVNKVRPLVGDGGWLVAVNNALFVSGAEYMQMLAGLCADGFLSLESRVDVPEDFTGYPHTRRGAPPVDPAPFNHSTKIAVLRVRRKDGRTAT